ncbi:hypothetical protein LINPERHAP2_LOCUS32358, partial [Linum perenne]
MEEELRAPTMQRPSACGGGDPSTASTVLRPIVRNIVSPSGIGESLGNLETINSGDEYSDESTPAMSGASDS